MRSVCKRPHNSHGVSRSCFDYLGMGFTRAYTVLLRPMGTELLRVRRAAAGQRFPFTAWQRIVWARHSRDLNPPSFVPRRCAAWCGLLLSRARKIGQTHLFSARYNYIVGIGSQNVYNGTTQMPAAQLNSKRQTSVVQESTMKASRYCCPLGWLRENATAVVESVQFYPTVPGPCTQGYLNNAGFVCILSCIRNRACVLPPTLVVFCYLLLLNVLLTFTSVLKGNGKIVEC